MSKKKAKGKLSNPTWLRNNDYGALDGYIKRHPEIFAHIEQDRIYGIRKTPEEWIKIAEKIASKHGGILPNCSWLINNGYNMLYQTVSNYPHLFKHIKQKSKKGKTPEENIKIAEQLTKNNNGVFPTRKWLQENKYSGLDRCMSTSPTNKLFKHIKRCRSFKTPKEWVKIARKMEKNNKGILPKLQWLDENKYGGLTQCLRKYPNLFKGIKQEYKNGVRIIGE